jgi:predicted nucleic acid-binding protein
MAEAISDTSAMFYLHQIGELRWFGEMFDEVWVPNAVVAELAAGCQKNYSVPDLGAFSWLRIVDPQRLPSQWLSLDLGRGELAVLGLALENPQHTVILDDGLARNVAHSAGLKVWGTLRVVLEAKRRGLTPAVVPLVDKLEAAGMWISQDIRARILALAGEAGGFR